MTYYDEGQNQSLAESINEDEDKSIKMESKVNKNFIPIGNNYESAKSFVIFLSLPMFFTGLMFFLFAYLREYVS